MIVRKLIYKLLLGVNILLVIFLVLAYLSKMVSPQRVWHFAFFGLSYPYILITNLAMTVGFMPVTGLPLPFLSYGGSFLIACMALMGFVMSVTKKSAEY